MRTTICGGVVMLAWLWLAEAGGARPPVEPHLSALRSDAAAVRAQAATALGRLAAREAVPPLIEALRDTDQAVRREAAQALGTIKDARAVPHLVEALGDGDANVRLYAAYALGEIKDSRAVDALVQSLGDPEWAVRDQARWALREIGDAEIAAPVVAALKAPGADVAGLVWLLRHLDGAEVIPHVAALLGDDDTEVRMRAVEVLGELRDPATVDALAEALEDGEAVVRGRAVAALVRIGGDRVLGPLQALAEREQDPAVREAAEQAVAEVLRHEAMAAHWSFDDGDAEVARDVGGREIHGQIHGCQPVEGKVGYALRFGPGTYIELGRPPELPIANQPFTIMAWAKSEADRGVVVARGGAYCGFSLYVKDGVAKFGIQREKDGPGYIAAGSERVVGRWVHLAGVVREDRIELYVDGELAATAETPGYIPSNCGQGMEIGHDLGTSPAEIRDHFQGIIDEVKAFEAALSAEEIVQQARGGGQPTGNPRSREHESAKR